ncbi:MAG: class II glutamine amidotransferase, partial [Burkholderiaceae bacterium]
MCGIVAALSTQNVVPFLLEGLKRLEYRGYDSAGLACATQGQLTRVRAVGRVAELVKASASLSATLGIAHTRWATHGGVTQDNAHPHWSDGQGLKVCLVHNGIIENHLALREMLTAQGYRFESQTDTEVIAHLLHRERLESPDLRSAFGRVLQQISGAYAIAAISSQDPGSLVASRRGAPLILGVSEDPRQAFLASDASALLQVTRDMVYLEDGDQLSLHTDDDQRVDMQIRDESGRPVKRPIVRSALSDADVALGPYRH